jgi:hypothetical protein
MTGQKRPKRRGLGAVVLLLAALAVLLCFLAALQDLDSGQTAQGREQLEAAVRQAAVACYAAEGVYPPDLTYLEDHYGLQIDETRYAVSYQVFASNLMPDITVLEKTP